MKYLLFAQTGYPSDYIRSISKPGRIGIDALASGFSRYCRLWQDVAYPALPDEDGHFFYAPEFTVINGSLG
jgi:hypothetical protein